MQPESVWDYPRPPAVRPVDHHVQVVLGGVTIADTRAAIQVLETSHPPTYYLPRDAFLDGAFEPAAGQSWCEFKGQASYLDLIGGDRRAARAGWYYAHPSPGFAALVDHISLMPGQVDRCVVDGEEVQPQAGNFYGGWITSRVVGPFKGEPGTLGW